MHSETRRDGRTGKAPSTPGRDRATTEARILAAVETILSMHGFAALGINEVARQAGVDKVLIYRYFGGLPELLRAFGERGNFWPSLGELLPDLPALREQGAPHVLATFLVRFIDALRNRPLTMEILAMEIAAPNALSQVLDEVREKWGRDVANALGRDDHAHASEINACVALIVAGAQHLLLRARRTEVFSGIPLQDDAGWSEIKHAIAWLTPRLLTNQER